MQSVGAFRDDTTLDNANPRSDGMDSAFRTATHTLIGLKHDDNSDGNPTVGQPFIYRAREGYAYSSVIFERARDDRETYFERQLYDSAVTVRLSHESHQALSNFRSLNSSWSGP